MKIRQDLEEQPRKEKLRNRRATGRSQKENYKQEYRKFIRNRHKKEFEI